MAWVGWYRLTGSSPWRRAVEADTVGDCAAALTAFLKAKGLKLHNLDQCLTGGAPPRVPPQRPGR
jgi:hypothetical protein